MEPENAENAFRIAKPATNHQDRSASLVIMAFTWLISTQNACNAQLKASLQTGTLASPVQRIAKFVPGIQKAKKHATFAMMDFC